MGNAEDRTHIGWGGRRTGSGRKKDEFRAVTLRIRPETDEIISQLSRDLGISKGKVVDLIVEQHVETIEEGE